MVNMFFQDLAYKGVFQSFDFDFPLRTFASSAVNAFFDKGFAQKLFLREI